MPAPYPQISNTCKESFTIFYLCFYLFASFHRVLSAPVNFEEFLKMPRFNISDLDAIFGGPTFIQFDKERFSEEQTETDLRNMEGRLKMSIQQVKETILGSVSNILCVNKRLKFKVKGPFPCHEAYQV